MNNLSKFKVGMMVFDKNSGEKIWIEKISSIKNKDESFTYFYKGTNSDNEIQEDQLTDSIIPPKFKVDDIVCSIHKSFKEKILIDHIKFEQLNDLNFSWVYFERLDDNNFNSYLEKDLYSFSTNDDEILYLENKIKKIKNEITYKNYKLNKMENELNKLKVRINE